MLIWSIPGILCVLDKNIARKLCNKITYVKIFVRVVVYKLSIAEFGGSLPN